MHESDTDAPARVQTRITVPDPQMMVSLLGSHDEILKLVERTVSSDIHVRGNEITISGQPADNAKAAADAAAKAAAQARANRSLVRAVLPKAAPRAVVAAPQIPANVGADGRAAAALRYAYAQLGKPYRYGGSGPGSFDCSGLTMRAWQAAGVSLGHNAAGQYASTPHVSRSQLQPGDLVYFGHPIHHVGIYIGGGKMIEAPYTGADVRITDFGYRNDYAGASRP